MLLSHYLLIALAALMTADLVTTLIGLRRGHRETDDLALIAMSGLGPVRGLITYQVVWLSLFAALVLAWPSQWAAPLVGVAASAFGTINNVVALAANKRSSS